MVPGGCCSSDGHLFHLPGIPKLVKLVLGWGWSLALALWGFLGFAHGLIVMACGRGVYLFVRWTSYFLASLTGLAMFSAHLLLIFGCLLAASRLLKSLLTTVLHAPLTFFDSTPLGRVLNRFSHDIEVLDRIIIEKLDWILQCIFEIIGTIFVISYATPWFVAAALPLMTVYMAFQVSSGLSKTPPPPVSLSFQFLTRDKCSWLWHS